MSTYSFETITAAQALAFNGQTDSLSFNTAATNLRVTYNPAGTLGPATLTVLDVSDNHLVVFGAGLELATHGSAFGGGVFVASEGGTHVVGATTPTADAFFGLIGPDTLQGQAGDDVLQGGQGADLLDGGAGSDLFLIASGDSPAVAGQTDTIVNWAHEDHLSFVFQNGQLLTPNANAFNYVETTASSFAAAQAAANAQIAGGVVEYVAVQVGGDVVVFADDQGDHGAADDAVTLQGASLADIDASNIVFGVTAPHSTFVSGPPVTPPPVTPPPVTPPPVTPPPVTPPPVAPPPVSPFSPFGVQFTVSGSLNDSFNLSGFHNLDIQAGSLQINITDQEFAGGVAYFALRAAIMGNGFTYDADGDLTGGTVTGFQVGFFAPPVNGVSAVASLSVSQIVIPVANFADVLLNGDATSLIDSFFAGNDRGFGASTDDILRGLGGDDVLQGGPGYDTIFGGDGNDAIYGLNDTGAFASPTEQNYLRGDAGADTVVGADGFDDINGNMGNDVLHGGLGGDWVVGGKDDDVQFGDAGDDVVWGNLGNDTLDGGDGNDQVRGGQGDDTLTGGNGDDFISGDRGNDTESGGAGADLFHDSQDAGIDRVLDFHLAEGDRVMLDPGTTYTLRQDGADTIIDFGAGNEMILVGVQLSTLTPGWIFGN